MTKNLNPDETILICGDTSNFADDIAQACRCGRVIYCRPHTAALVPPEQRVCAGCGLQVLQVHPVDEVEVRITEETAAEVALWFEDTKGNH